MRQSGVAGCAAGVLVLTDRGHLPIEQVRPGDLVLTHRNRWRPVHQVVDLGAQPTVRVRGSGHAHGLRVTPGLGLYLRGDRPGGLSQPRWRPVADVTPRRDRDDRWAAPTTIPPLALPELARPYPCGHRNHLDPTHLSSEDLWWLVGLFAAEGSTGSSFGAGQARNRAVWSLNLDVEAKATAALDSLGLNWNRWQPASGAKVAHIVVASATLTSFHWWHVERLRAVDVRDGDDDDLQSSSAWVASCLFGVPEPGGRNPLPAGRQVSEAVHLGRGWPVCSANVPWGDVMGGATRARGRIGVRGTGVLVMLLAIARVLALSVPVAGAQVSDDAGPTRSTTEDLGEKRYVAAGDRAYVIGTADGGFPAMGWHIRGEMGGVWAHPIKLLDGYWFAIDGQWLPPAENFTTGAGYVEMEYPSVDGLEVTRTEFAPDDTSAVLVGLTVRNPDQRARPFRLEMDVRSDLLAAYPWSETEPNAREFNNPDEVRFDRPGRTLAFTEPERPWTALVGATPRPTDGRTGDRFWGPLSAEEQEAHQEFGAGTGGQLRWQVPLGGGEETTLWIAVAGSHEGESQARDALDTALDDPEQLLAEKVEGRREAWKRTRVDLPDTAMQEAFDWGKLNLADLRITATELQVRDVDEGRAYPPPVTTIPEATGIGAGFPDYPWYFGTDGAYTAYPLLVSGQWDTLKDHLRLLRDVSRALNGETGKIVHEIVTDGSVYFGTLDHPGQYQETPQFAAAVELVWRWTGDEAFLEEMYDIVVDGLESMVTIFDEDGDGWPEGDGMVERPGMGDEKLDVAAYTWRALRGLEGMARDLGDEETATWARDQADAMAAAFDDAWWMPDEQLYADSRCNAPEEDPEDDWVNFCEEADQLVQQRHWINAVPAEVGLAPDERAHALLDTLEGPDFTGDTGLFHTGRGGGPDGAGELRVWTLPSSVMAVGEATYGRLGEDEALFYMHTIADLLDLEMPGALPEIAPSPDYDPFQDFRDRAMFMQAWSSYGVQWPVIHHFLGIRPDVPAGRLTVVPHVPPSWPGLSVEALQIGEGVVAAEAARDGDTYTTTVDAGGGWDLFIGHTLPADAEVEAVTLDGEPADYEAVETSRGLEIRVDTTTAELRTLVVTTAP